MKSIKKILQGTIRCTLTLISPKLNTSVTFRVKFGRKLDFRNPQTLNEKIQWLKFNTYWNNPVVKQCADKYRVRDYLIQQGQGNLLNDLLGVYDDIEGIDFSSLPSQFALKMNVGCSHNIIVKDKTQLDIEQTKKKLKKWMKDKYYWLGWSEMQYKGVKPYILIEKYLGDNQGHFPVDYKFYCMNGKATSVMVCEERDSLHHPKFFFMNREWQKLPYTKEAFQYPDYQIKKPECIDKAFEIAEELSKEFPFVRVDLYIVGEKIYFEELTFTPAGGMDTEFKFKAPGVEKDTDTILGEQLKLPI